MVLILGAGLIQACAPMAVAVRSEPPVRSSSTDLFRIDFKPVRQQANIFNGFTLAIENTSGDDITVDWNKTRYMHNGRGRGVFLFKGLSAQDLNNIPEDVIAPGRSLSRELWPVELVAIAPHRSAIFSMT